jgi:hypothetical protein
MMDLEPQTEVVLASPLEWGLGHTARLVPFIREAMEEGHRVILAADGRSLDFLRYRFPALEWVRMPFYPVRYPSDGKFIRKLLPQIPGMIRAIRRNRKQLGRLVAEYGITRVISDNRYGLHHKGVHSVFITSQLWLMAPRGWHFGEGWVYLLHRLAIRKFTEIRIADYGHEPSLTGQLTHPRHLPRRAVYIGPVSRFRGMTPAEPRQPLSFDVLALVSGPEPQRTLFEDLLRKVFSRTHTKALILRGLPPTSPDGEPTAHTVGNLVSLDHAPDGELLWYIIKADLVICRPGISSLSDLDCLGKEAILVPTPGQTEQEYMAAHLAAAGRFRMIHQEQLADPAFSL